MASSPKQPPEQPAATREQAGLAVAAPQDDAPLGPPDPVGGQTAPPSPPIARQLRRVKSISKTSRHVFLIIGLVSFVLLCDRYASSIASGKASDWLTSYNGAVTTSAVGRITVDLDAKGTSLPPQSTKFSSSLQSAGGMGSSVAVLAQQLDANTNKASSTAPTPAPAGTTQSGAADPSATPIPPPTQEEAQRLKDQLQTIRDRTRHHGAVMTYFYEKYYGAITMVMIAGLIVAITLFFIAQKGWDHTSSYVKAVFVVMSATAAFYGLLPPVFEQEKNITDNKELFLQYKILESEVGSYPLTHTTVKNDPKSAKDFINYIDAEMARIGNIAVGFDITKVNYKNAIDLNKNPDTTPNAASTNVNMSSTQPASRKKQ